jgi:hypothetical protein
MIKVCLPKIATLESPKMAEFFTNFSPPGRFSAVSRQFHRRQPKFALEMAISKQLALPHSMGAARPALKILVAPLAIT